jgi:hypothetical protein
MENYVTGTPSLEESCDLWKVDLNEPEIDYGEYLDASMSLTDHLELKYPGANKGDDLYVRGDWFGDKTQYVYFYLPEIIDMDFLAYLQVWLRTYGNNDWRILVATEIGNEEAVMVYPNAIRTGSRYEHDLPGSLALIVRKMREQDEAYGHPCFKPPPNQSKSKNS